jgi:hypothetical protein
LAYPNPNKPFNIKTDTSDYQLGTVIKQHDRPVTFFSHRLIGTQRNYSTIQKELLSVVETLTTFHPILLGSKFEFGPTMPI